jgi:nucleoside phosphorylase
MGATAIPAVTWFTQHCQVWGVLNVGFAGGLQPHLGTGNAVLVTQVHTTHTDSTMACLGHSAAIEPDSALTHLAAVAAERAALRRHAGILLSTTELVLPAADKQRLGQHSGALAVDLESYGIGCIVAAQHLPFVVLRTIFDTSGDDLPASVATFTTPTGVLQTRHILGYCARHPQTLMHLLYLGYKARVAGKCLEAWLQHFLTLLSQQPCDDFRANPT